MSELTPTQIGVIAEYKKLHPELKECSNDAVISIMQQEMNETGTVFKGFEHLLQKPAQKAPVQVLEIFPSQTQKEENSFSIFKKDKSKPQQGVQAKNDGLMFEFSQNTRVLNIIKNRFKSAQQSFDNQIKYDGWAGDLADFAGKIYNSENTADKVRADLKEFENQLKELENGKNSGEKAFGEAFEKIFGTKYNPKKILDYNKKETQFQIATACVEAEKYFSSKMQNLLNKPKLEEEKQRSSLSNRFGERPTITTSTKEQVFERELNAFAEILGKGNRENGLKELNEVFNQRGAKTNEEKYEQMHLIAKDYQKQLKDNIKNVSGNKDYTTLQKEYERSYKDAFGNKNDIAKRVTDYNNSQMSGASLVKGTVTLAGAMTLGLLTGGSGLAFFPSLLSAGASSAAVTATVGVTDRLSSGNVTQKVKEGFADKGIEGAIQGLVEGGQKALNKEEILKILKASGINGATVIAGGLASGGIEVMGKALQLSSALKGAAHVVSGTLVGAGAEYTNTGTITIEGVAFSFVLSATGQLIALKKIATTEAQEAKIFQQKLADAKSELGLSLDKQLNEGDIVKAFRAKMLQVHPDRGGSPEAATALNSAKEFLMESLNKDLSKTLKLSYAEDARSPKDDFYTNGELQHRMSYAAEDSIIAANKYGSENLVQSSPLSVSEKVSFIRDYFASQNMPFQITSEIIWALSETKPETFEFLRFFTGLQANGAFVINQNNLEWFLKNGAQISSIENLSKENTSRLLEFFSRERLKDVDFSKISNSDKIKEFLENYQDTSEYEEKYIRIFQKEFLREEIREIETPKFQKIINDTLKSGEKDIVSLRKIISALKKIEKSGFGEIQNDPQLISEIMKTVGNIVENSLDIIEVTRNVAYIQSLINSNLSQRSNSPSSSYQESAIYQESLERINPVMGSVLKNFRESEAFDINKLLKEEPFIAEEAKKVFGNVEDFKIAYRDYINDFKTEGLKKFFVFCNEKNQEFAKRLYDTAYLKKLPEELRNICEKISDNFGTKVFLGEAKDKETAKQIYNQLFESYKTSKGEMVLPIVIDLSSAKDFYLPDEKRIAGLARPFEKTVFLDKKDVSGTIVMHELTHCNDQRYIKREKDPKDFADIAVYKKDERGNILKDKEGLPEVDLEKSKYVEIFRKAEVKERLIEYAYTSRQEFIAVASEGDFAVYNLPENKEFKNVLIKLGMPEWMFDISIKSSLMGYYDYYKACECVEHNPLSDLQDLEKLSDNAKKLYLSSIKGLEGIKKDVESFSASGSLKTETKSFEGILKGFYERLQDADKKPETAQNRRRELIYDFEVARAEIPDIIKTELTTKKNDEKTTGKIVSRIDEKIKSGDMKILKVGNYAPKGEKPYFSSVDIKKILLSCRQEGYGPEIISTVNAPKDKQELYRQKFQADKAENSEEVAVKITYSNKEGTIAQLEIKKKS